MSGEPFFYAHPRFDADGKIVEFVLREEFYGPVVGRLAGAIADDLGEVGNTAGWQVVEMNLRVGPAEGTIAVEGAA